MLGGRQLAQSASVVLNGSGNGSVALGPTVVRERWAPAQVTVQVSTDTLQATCELFLGVGNVPGRSMGTSSTGSSGDTMGFGGFELQPGQQLILVWTGGDPGATATASIYGERLRIA